MQGLNLPLLHGAGLVVRQRALLPRVHRDQKQKKGSAHRWVIKNGGENFLYLQEDQMQQKVLFVLRGGHEMRHGLHVLRLPQLRQGGEDGGGAGVHR
jgi:hypothetical protein